MEMASLPFVDVLFWGKTAEVLKRKYENTWCLTGTHRQTKQTYSQVQSSQHDYKTETLSITESRQLPSRSHILGTPRAGNLLFTGWEIQQKPGMVINSLPGFQPNKPNSGSPTAKKTQRETCLKAELTQQKWQHWCNWTTKWSAKWSISNSYPDKLSQTIGCISKEARWDEMPL